SRTKTPADKIHAQRRAKTIACLDGDIALRCPDAAARRPYQARSHATSCSNFRMSILRASLMVSILQIATAVAQLNQSSSLAEVQFSQWSQRDPNPLGEIAPAIQPAQWKHAETEHFVYHFIHSYVATPV